MDIWDKIGVVVYRSGFVLAAVAFALLVWQEYQATGQKVATVAAAVAASSLHIYMKSVRTTLQYAAWLGLILTLLSQPLLGFGMALVTLGGLAYKEHFCFKVLGLNFQPLICILLWFSIAFDWHVITTASASVSTVLFAVLSVKKALMPLYFDIGDKSKYQQ